MMEKLFHLVFTLSTCAAVTQDLSGKVFVFPKENNVDHVKLLTSKTEFAAYTTCLRFLSDLTRQYSLFSLATPTRTDAIVFDRHDSDTLRLQTLDQLADFDSLSFQGNRWHSLCVTWHSENGLSQLWLDGVPNVKKFITSGAAITGTPITILGQEQDAHGGSFDADQSFIGMISDVHMWDTVLSPIDLQRYMKRKHFTPGNVFNWRALEYNITGAVFIDDDPEDLPW